MLTVQIPAQELFDDETSKFRYAPSATLTLEHSLVSLSKWESKWKKPFLGKDKRSMEETLDYIKCMSLSPEEVPEIVYQSLPNEILNQITEYINDKMTATWFNEIPGQSRPTTGEVITAEIIYYWIVALQIDFQVQEWHLNRLLTLIRVVNLKNDPKKKMMPKKDAAAQQRMLNEERKIRLGTKG